MNEEITYGVYWTTRVKPSEYQLFFGYCKDYDTAYQHYTELINNNPMCHMAWIVERTEHYETITRWESGL